MKENKKKKKTKNRTKMARPFALQANTILSFKKPIAELRGSTFFFVFINIHFSFVDVKARFHIYIN